MTIVKYDLEKDITKIKNGMTFADNSGNTWLKVGKKCIKIKVCKDTIKDFSDFSQDDIKAIFKTSGTAMYVAPIIDEVEDENS